MGNWIKELLSGEEKTVYVNYERGEGCTSAILTEVLKKDYKRVLYVGLHSDWVRNALIGYNLEDRILVEKPRYVELKNDFDNTVKVDCLFGTLNKGDVVGVDYDLIIFDPYFNNIPEWIYKQNCKIICILPERVKIVNSDKKLKEIIKNNKANRCQVVEGEIDRLLQELSSVDPNSNTTMTRERLVSMISKMVNVRTELIENKAGGNNG